jgi:hypothetical protein
MATAQADLSKTINDFNSVTFTLMDFISKLSSESVIANNLPMIKQCVNANPLFVMEFFIEYVVKYKKEIMEGNEKFFLENSYAETGGDTDALSKILDLKKLWVKLNQTNKQNIINYMKCLCIKTLQYKKIVGK